ncbi:MAG: hypothetical protein IKK33_08390 [Lachnospiraceae bacterium]|nr:hypothetical protein [Lachnospiraceae bacterium]
MRIELSNMEVYEFCILDTLTGKKSFSKDTVGNDFAGFYFYDSKEFFAIYSTKEGPMIYYKNKQYSINPDLHTYVKRMGEWREFDIREYGIHIRYKTSPYIGFDVWSEEEDVDLFCYLESKYKKEEFYQRFTKE